MGYKEFESHDGFAYTRLFDAPIEEIKRTYEAIAQMIFIAGGPLNDDIIAGLNDHMENSYAYKIAMWRK